MGTEVKVVVIGSDHGGFSYKEKLIPHLRDQGYTVRDCGTHSTESVDYPQFARKVAETVSSGAADAGIMIDGAGIGSAMTANRVPGVLAAACYSPALARNSREHNGANLLTLGAGHLSLHEATGIVDTFLQSRITEPRHKRRVAMIRELDGGRAPSRPTAPPPSSAPPAPAPRPPDLAARIKEGTDLNLPDSDIQRITQRVRDLMTQRHMTPPATLGGPPDPDALARMIDHTLLKPDAKVEDIRTLCEEARTYHFWSVCVNSVYVPEARNALRGSDVHVCCVVGFPLGAMPPDIKAAEARKAIREGTQEVDMVINVGALKSKQEDLVLDDIRSVVEACRERNVLCKVILETALLTDEEKIRACQMSMQAGADFVKTSTGFSSGGATVHDVALMKSTVAAQNLGVKASGGIRCYDDALSMIEAGATRIGASSSVAIVEEARAVQEGRPYVKSGKQDNY